MRVLSQGQMDLFDLAFARLVGLDLGALPQALLREGVRLVALACRGAGIDRSVFATVFNLSRQARSMPQHLEPATEMRRWTRSSSSFTRQRALDELRGARPPERRFVPFCPGVLALPARARASVHDQASFHRRARGREASAAACAPAMAMPAPKTPTIVVALGGDGFMLQTLHAFTAHGQTDLRHEPGLGRLPDERISTRTTCMERLAAAEKAVIHPLQDDRPIPPTASTEARAFNEVSLLRETRQAAKIRILVDGKPAHLRTDLRRRAGLHPRRLHRL